MKLSEKEITLSHKLLSATVKRNDYGVPEIFAEGLEGLAFGQGWVHACDRQLQILLARILLNGRAAEILSGDAALIEVDRFMRRMNFVPDAESELAKLEPGPLAQLQAYADGFNLYIEDHGAVSEMKLLGYRPDPWQVKDTFYLAKVMGLLGLSDAQGNMEKFIIQMIQNGIDEKRMKELFPYIAEKIDKEIISKIILAPSLVPDTLKWLAILPRFTASNNWVVSGEHTASGSPMLCSDPHLEINRLPSVWQEIVLRTPEDVYMGASIPGSPGLPIGRSQRLAWGATYSFMDQIDFRIEECRDGKYRRGLEWKPFHERKEEIQVKKGQTVVEYVYENDIGILEGDPKVSGTYLIMCWSAAKGCVAGDMNGILNLLSARNVKEGMAQFRRLEANSFNYVLADVEGNIGYQMSGRLFDRPRGASGLIPLPAWERKYDPKGFVPASKLPSLYNPKNGMIVTANQDLNHLGKAKPINLPMGSYRADRIAQLLSMKDSWDIDGMKDIHYDLYSIQAESFMKVLRPMVPDTDNGRLLKEWNCVYDAESKGAMLFESVYLALLRVVFGDGGMGREVVDYCMTQTGLFNDYYANFDAILFKKKSAWFGGRPREELFRTALDEGLAVKALPYGRTRRVMLPHLLFGGKLPRFFGYDRGPIELPGSRATVPQGQIFKSAGRTTTFSPSYRMIADMAVCEIHTNLAGGATDRRFSKWYVSDLDNWFNGVYKVLK